MRTSPLVQIRRRRAPGLLTRGKEQLLAAHARWLHVDHPLRPAVTGAVMAFLPCMISLWALGLAATTGSVLWGALVMVCLALMTTPMLLLVSIFASTFSRMASGHRRRLQQGLTLLAGTWLLLVGAAGLGLVPHQHLAVAGYTVMFF